MARRVGYSVKKLRSGRYQLLLRDPLTKQQFGMGSYKTEKEADRAGLDHLADQRKGVWIDPRKGEIPLSEYLDSWLSNKAATGKHSPRYQELARLLVRNYINPTLGSHLVADLRPSTINTWYDRLIAERQPNPGLMPAKAFRLLRAALNDAVENELLGRNPAVKREAGVERSAERPLLEPAQIASLAASVAPWWRALVLTAGWCGLRFGELQRLRRADVDLSRGTLRVTQAKTAAGVRTVAVPEPLIPILTAQVNNYSETDPNGLVFVGPKGGKLVRSNFTVDFRRAADALGLTHVHFHDLRHAAGTMAAQEGATEREIMSRLGHASPDAARRYQHAAQRRDQELAARLAERMRCAQGANLDSEPQIGDENTV